MCCKGGLLGNDGAIYGIPYNAAKILKKLARFGSFCLRAM